MPIDAPVRKLRTLNTDDPRFRRTRAQLCTAARRLLESTDPARITFGQVAAEAGVNRSTVHQHYANRHELIADALAGELAEIARPLGDCPFVRRSRTPAELVAMFTAAAAQRPVLARLDPAARALVTERLAEQLTAQLTARFADSRPAGFGTVPADVHARYVAGGLARLLLTDGDPGRLAAYGWALIAPLRSTTVSSR